MKLGSATDMNANVGGAGCRDLAAVLDDGVITDGSQTFGLVADGNPTVTVCMTSGRRVTVPVKNNAFIVDVPGRPATLSFKNAYGKPTRQFVWGSKRCTTS